MSSSSFLFFFITFGIGMLLMVVIISWMIKAMIAREMTQKFEAFRQSLKEETDKKLSEFTALAQRQKSHGASERTEKVVHLYAYLMDLVKAGKGFGAIRSMEQLGPKARKMADYGQDFLEEYQKGGLFLSDGFCQYLDRNLETLEALCALFASKTPTSLGEAEEAALVEEYQKVWKRFEDLLPGLVIELKKEYNRIGAADAQSPNW